MEYYVNTTSERATKSQGGNKYIRIEVLDKNRKQLAFLSIVPTENTTQLQFSLFNPDWKISQYAPKGERFSMSGILEKPKTERETCKAMIGRKIWCDNWAFKKEYCKKHYEEFKSEIENIGAHPTCCAYHTADGECTEIPS